MGLCLSFDLKDLQHIGGGELGTGPQSSPPRGSCQAIGHLGLGLPIETASTRVALKLGLGANDKRVYEMPCSVGRCHHIKTLNLTNTTQVLAQLKKKSFSGFML